MSTWFMNAPMYTIQLNVLCMFIILEKLPKSINEFRDIRRCNNETNTMWVHLSSINQKNVEKIVVVKKFMHSTSLKISYQILLFMGVCYTTLEQRSMDWSCLDPMRSRENYILSKTAWQHDFQFQLLKMAL